MLMYELPFLHPCMHVHQGADRLPNGRKPPVQAHPKSVTTDGKQFKGKFNAKLLIIPLTIIVGPVSPCVFTWTEVCITSYSST